MFRTRLRLRPRDPDPAAAAAPDHPGQDPFIAGIWYRGTVVCLENIWYKGTGLSFKGAIFLNFFRFSAHANITKCEFIRIRSDKGILLYEK